MLARSIFGGRPSFPSNHSADDMAGLMPIVGGKMSSWNTSALRGTRKDIGSIYESLTVLKARMTSFSWTFTPRFGRNAMPR